MREASSSTTRRGLGCDTTAPEHGCTRGQGMEYYYGAVRHYPVRGRKTADRTA